MSLWFLGVIAFATSQALHLHSGRHLEAADIAQGVAFLAIGTTGMVVSRHQPQNPLGWIFLGVWEGVALVFGLAGEYGYWATVAHPGAPAGTFAVWLGNWVWVPIFGGLLTFPFLLFPDGHLPSARWRPVAWALVIVTFFWSIAFALEGHDYTDARNRTVPNPYTPARLVGFFDVAREVLAVAFIALVGLCVASLVIRFRRGSAEKRAQIKWLMFAGAVYVVFLSLPFEHGNGGPADLVMGFVLALIPLSIGVAILKYRLFDIDIVLSKTVVYGALAAFITAVYVAVVVGLGRVLGTGDRPSAPLSITATAIVAVAFQPVKRRVQRFANRLVFGKRATPYEVLARFSERVAGTYATEDVLPRIARVIAEGTNAEWSQVWLRIDEELRLAAAWPSADDQAPSTPMALEGGMLPPFAGADLSVPVTSRDELLGALTIAKRRGEPLTPQEAMLVNDLAKQAGLVLSNVRLAAELEARLDQIGHQAAELRASRQRIVAAQDAERRRLERNIHDGAQQHLVALAVKLRLARDLMARDPERARAILAELRDEVDEALDTLHGLALGIYPPLLEQQGIASALAAQYARGGVNVRMSTVTHRRYPIETEAAVYFCVLEALQNAAKYANASAIDIRLEERDGVLEFEVVDDGVGFDPRANGGGTGLAGMRDRLAVLGGDGSVESAPGKGTRVRGRIPIPTVGAVA